MLLFQDLHHSRLCQWLHCLLGDPHQLFFVLFHPDYCDRKARDPSASIAKADGLRPQLRFAEVS